MSYLDDYISAVATVSNQEESIIITNTDSVFMFATSGMSNLVGIKEKQGLIGKTYSDLESLYNLAPMCRQEDEKCIKERKSFNFVTLLHTQEDVPQIFLKKKEPIIDESTDQTVAIKVQFNKLINVNYQQLLLSMHDERYNKNNFRIKKEQIALTENEELILFLLLINNNTKFVCGMYNRILNKSVSCSTISSIIHQQLHKKFGTLSILELIDLAISLGYDAFIPSKLVKEFSIQVGSS